MFEVTNPATSRAILSADELRLAANLSVTDSSLDGRLAELGLRASDAIARQCKIASDGVNIPTLFSEACRDTFRPQVSMSSLVLSRRFVTAIASVVEDGVTLTADDYEIERSSGVLRRVSDNMYIRWLQAKIVVTYTAGFSSMPTDLKHAAELVVRQMSSQTDRDPMVRRERVDGVGETEYWVGTVDGGDSPTAMAVRNLLRPYTSWGA